MDPKKVWGLILIILGVLFFLGGIANFCRINTEVFELRALVQGLDQQLGSFYNKRDRNILSSQFSNAYFKEYVKRQKFYSIVSTILGFIMSWIGTDMIRYQSFLSQRNPNRRSRHQREIEL